MKMVDFGLPVEVQRIRSEFLEEEPIVVLALVARADTDLEG